MTKLFNQLNQYEMNPELTFIAPSIIGLRDAIKKLTVPLEQKPKYPPQKEPTENQVAMMERYIDFQVRFGAVIDEFELEIDKMIIDL